MDNFWKRGSLSLEASATVPLFLFAVISMISIIQFYKANMDMDTVVYETSRELALYSWVKDIEKDQIGEGFDLLGTGVTDGYAYFKASERYSEKNGCNRNILTSDITPLNFIFSSEKDDIVDVVCVYKVEPAINFYNVKPWILTSRARVHLWNGYKVRDVPDEDEERIVYITENGIVYHLTKSCNYLDLSIVSAQGSEISALRNKSGGKYHACKKCRPSVKGQIYITDYGDTYHDTLTCSGLKRTIKEIPVSKVGNKKCCSKCAG